MAPTDDTGPADPNPYQLDDDEPDDDLSNDSIPD